MTPARQVGSYFAAACLTAAATAVDSEVTATLGTSFTTDLAGNLYLPVHFAIAPGWHLYWKNGGDAGMPPTVRLTLPEGWRAGETLFPRPTILREGDGFAYAYEKDLTLMVPISAPATGAGSAAHVAAAVSWLVCKESCVMGKAALEGDVAVPGPSSGGPLPPAFPQPAPPSAARLEPGDGGVRLLISVAPTADGKAYFVPDVCPGVAFDREGPIPLHIDGTMASGSADLTITPEDAAGGPLRVRGLILFGPSRTAASYSVDLPVPAGSGGQSSSTPGG